MAIKSRTSYTSKGQRRNVAKKTLNVMNSDRRTHPSVKDMMIRWNHRQEIINKPRSTKQKELRERYLEEDRVDLQAHKLMDQYRDVNLSKATAVQAAKTNFIEQLHSKWSPKLKAFREASKGKFKNKIIS